MVGAQTKGQFHLIYGNDGTQALLTGLATQIVYGGGDHDTAEFYSKASGTATVDANPDPHRANLRQRPLLTADEIVNPQNGNSTIFSRFVEANFASQVILTAQLTRLYEREDWTERFQTTADDQPFRLRRGFSKDVRAPETTPSAAVKSAPAAPRIVVPLNTAPVSSGQPASDFEQQAAERMQAVRAQAPRDLLAEAGVATTTLGDLRARYGKKRDGQPVSSTI